MSLGLPAHLAQRVSSSAFMRALQTVALTCLAAAFLTALVFQAARPHDTLWPAMIAVVPMAVLLWLQFRTRSLFFAVSFLIVGAASTYLYILTFSVQNPPILQSDAFTVAFPKIALLMMGGSGIGLARRFIWVAIGYVTAELADGAALLTTGHSPEFDVVTFRLFVVISLTLFGSYLSRRIVHRTQPVVLRAAQDERVATMRSRLEGKAAALMHDTVLNQLAAIASSSGDTLEPRLREQIEQDMHTLMAEEWLEDSPANASLRENDREGVAGAVREARALGLAVDVSGEVDALGRLGGEAAVALGLAVKQCLVNVLKHAGTGSAEVVIYGTSDEVSVMVIDAGRGFSETEAGTDRLGLRSSVRRRMESVGGSVRVWSTPGRGTSIMIRLPARLVEVASDAGIR